MKYLLIFYLWTLACQISGQSVLSNISSPVTYPTVLSGSYGEPRSKHFHAGIDFKPYRGIPHDTIYAANDGYISRISVTPDGYGNALYIAHPDGYTTVYAHLHEFNSHIKKYIEEIMVRKKVYRIQHFPDARMLPVRKGDPIGILGNSGGSTGAHLHFEIRESKGQIPMNPELFGIGPKDSRSPTIMGLFVYTLTPENEVTNRQYFKAIRTAEGSYKLDPPVLELGALMVGLGIHAYDTMDGASNHNGIYGIDTYVDKRHQFGFALERIPFDQSKFIHIHMDYEEKLQNRYVSKCYGEEHNPLDIYQMSEKMGKIYLYEELPSEVSLKVKDYQGNASTLDFHIKRSDVLDPLIPTYSQNRLRLLPQDSITLDDGNHSVHISPLTFLTPVNLKLDASDSNRISMKQTRPIPTFKPIKITSQIDRKTKNREKLVYATTNEKGENVHFGGTWQGDTIMTTMINRLDDFEIIPDIKGPEIQIVTLPSSENRVLKIKIKDDFIHSKTSDRVRFEIKLNGDWTLFKHDGKTHTLSLEMPEFPENQTFDLSVWARDSRNNTSVLETTFIY